MAACEPTSSSSSTSGSSSATGVILTLLSCFAYSLGNNMQRYALLQPKGQKVFYFLNRNIAWFLGACIYFSGNGIYAVALSFAPVSVLSVVFSLTIITNAACARCLLGDRVPMMAIPGYIFILVGAILFSFMVEADVCHFDGDELVVVLTSTSAIIFWVILALVILGGGCFAKWFEKNSPMIASDEMEKKTTEPTIEPSHESEEEVKDDEEMKNDINETRNEINDEEANESDKNYNSKANASNTKIYLLARVIYPTSLGAVEAAGTLILKAVNSLFTKIVIDDSNPENLSNGNLTSTISNLPDSEIMQDNSNISLWVGLFVSGVILFLGIIGWLRLVYRRFEISGAFPIEFGFVTFASVIGGFAVYQDHQFVNGTSAWVGVVCAGMLILSGIGVVAFSSWHANLSK